MKKILTAVIIALLSLNTAYASNCGPRVDEVQLFYVNGMFTTYQKFGANKAAYRAGIVVPLLLVLSG
jgi:hypothetical protein